MKNKQTVVNLKNYLMLFLVLLILSCTNDKIEVTESISNIEECELLFNLGNAYLDPDSKEFVPYPDSTKRVVFRDSTGQEFKGIISGFNEIYSPNILSGSEKPCPIDSSLSFMYKYKPEYLRRFIKIDELDLRLSISLYSTISNSNYEAKLLADVCSVNLNYPANTNGSNGYMSIVVNRRTHPNPYESYSDFYGEYEILGEVFQNVYINRIEEDEKFEIFYNDQYGILGFKTLEYPFVDLVYERLEF